MPYQFLLMTVICISVDVGLEKPLKMNVFRLSYRTLRPVATLFIAILLLYVIINVIYISFMDIQFVDSSKDSLKAEADSFTANVKFGKPNANGKVEIVLSVDMEQLSNMLDNSDIGKLLSAETDNSVLKLTGAMPSNVSFLIHNPNLCDSLNTIDLSWIVVVHSAPRNFNGRTLLRETWANPGLFRQKRFTTVFLLGLTDDSTIQEKVQNEFNTHHDIVQGNFLDTTRNSTLKGLMGLKYVSNFCSHAKYLIKVNDDTFLNVFKMMHQMEMAKSRKRTVICPVWQDNTMRILRDPKSCMNWCVAENELPGRTYFPQYCAGLAFVISRDLISALHNKSFSTPYFWIDDVYITGLLMPRVATSGGGVHYIDIAQNFTQNENLIESQYSDSSQPITFLVAKTFNGEVFRRTWKALLNRLSPKEFKLLSDSVIAGM